MSRISYLQQVSQDEAGAAAARPVVASYPDYAGAQRAMDHLADDEFPVDRTAIVGTDLRMVETVLGRLTLARATGAGAGTGAWFGLLVGLLLSLFVDGGASVLLTILSGVFYGALFGAVFGFAGQAMTGGQRDFASRNRIVAAHYDVVADQEVAEDAKNRLIKLGWRES
ncbi:general stress protein [Streptomyces sp. NBRC 109706]|uniref:general stress protein n=1 Tax=Streptomyces sp. NBRC 109706 TaxID=1550035 RepID=UPI0007809605|nr:general stress protein [Streptomyces sp. NBRC 109706]